MIWPSQVKIDSLVYYYLMLTFIFFEARHSFVTVILAMQNHIIYVTLQDEKEDK